MPTIDIDYEEFERMLGVTLSKNTEKIDDVLALVKGEVRLFDEKEGLMSVEIKDTNRPDTWNIEGLVRALRGFTGKKEGLIEYALGKQEGEVFVDRKLERIRPFIGCALIRGLRLSDKIIRGLMHLQDKLDQTYGRNRQKTSIGLYNLDLIKLPLKYAVAEPDEVSFVPLGFTEKMTLREMLDKHPKGQEYGYIVAKHNVYPILLDADGKPLSFPPIINSDDRGKISEVTRNVLVEVTGTRHDAVLNVLRIVTLSLIDRGGTAYTVKIHYPHRKVNVTTPDFAPRKIELDTKYANRMLGLKLSSQEIARLLPKAGYGVDEVEKRGLVLRVPCWRVDVMHAVDVIEDVAIAYDFNRIESLWREMPTTGAHRHGQHYIDIVRDLMVGLGFQEILTPTLTNPDNLFTRMNVPRQPIIEIANPKITTLTCLRNWLLPSLLEFTSRNLHVECPQRIFETGKTTVPDPRNETGTRDEEMIAAVMYHANASFTEAKQNLDALLTNLGLTWQIKESKHPSFIEGRTGSAFVAGTDVGILGEINPKILGEWKLENPVAAFEINLQNLSKTRT